MDHFSYKNGDYYAEDVSLRSIAEEVGTPFYCYSSATIERHYKVFRESFGDMPVKVCYAVKANEARAVIRTLANMGAGADVVSEGEIRQALEAGVKPDNIVFSGVAKTEGEMAFALQQGIFQFNVESAPELEQLDRVAESLGKRARIAIRVNPDVDPDTHAKISTGMKETKFGINMSQALDVYRHAASLPGIDVQGVSVHIGSQLTKLEPFREAFTRVKAFVEQLRAEGIDIRTIDLGGGLGVPYGPDDPPTPAKYADTVREIFDGESATLMFEPGRLIVANAGILVSKIIYVKRGESRTFVIADAGMNDLIRPTLYEAWHDVVPVREPKPDEKTEPVDFVGPVCETGDIFASGRPFVTPHAGELIAFRTAGAYGATMASTYNARPLLAEVMVKGDNYSVIRPRQTYIELAARDHLPDWLK